MDEMLTFENRQAFRTWLDANGATSGGVWLLFGKKGGPVTLTANEALEEALCYGWIDGQMQSLDSTVYKKYFARRTPKSNWSEKNKKIVKVLLEQGRVETPGLEAIERAKKTGMWDKEKSGPIGEEQVEAFRQLVKPHEPAYTNLMGMSPSVQRNYTGFYLDAKSESSREARLLKIIDRLNQNLKPM